MSTQLSLRLTCPLLMLSFTLAQKSGFSVRPNISRWEMAVPSSAAWSNWPASTSSLFSSFS